MFDFATISRLFNSIFLAVILIIWVVPSYAARSDSKDQSVFEPRDRGQVALPIFRLDLDTQYVYKNINSLDYQLEFGIGAFAASYRQSHFREDNNGERDKLRIEQAFLLYRMRFARSFELDFGVGNYQLRSDNEVNDLAVTLPMRWYPVKNIGAEFRPTWNFNGVSDHQLLVIAGWEHFKFRAGYHWLEMKSKNLNGPFVGISLHY